MDTIDLMNTRLRYLDRDGYLNLGERLSLIAAILIEILEALEQPPAQGKEG